MAGNKDLFTNTTHEGLSQGEKYSRWLQLSYPLGPCGLRPNGLSLPINHYNSEAAYLLGSAKSSHPPHYYTRLRFGPRINSRGHPFIFGRWIS